MKVIRSGALAVLSLIRSHSHRAFADGRVGGRPPAVGAQGARPRVHGYDREGVHGLQPLRERRLARARHDPGGVLVLRRIARHGGPQRARGALGARRRDGEARDASRREHAAQARDVLRDVHGFGGGGARGNRADEARAERGVGDRDSRAAARRDHAAADHRPQRALSLQPRRRRARRRALHRVALAGSGSASPIATTTRARARGRTPCAPSISRTSRRC